MVPGTLMQVSFSIYDLMKIHERHSYGLIELVGDLGGVLEVIVVVLGVFI